MQPIWVVMEPCPTEVRVLLTEPGLGPSLKARLPPPAAASRGPLLLLQALSAWYGRPLHAVLDADAEDVQRHPERWIHLAGDLPFAELSVQWARRVPAAQRKRRGRMLEDLGTMRSACSLLGLTVTGLP